MRRFLRSTRGRLVLFQVAVLTAVSGLTASVLYEYVAVSRLNEADNVLYDQWTTIADGLELQQGGVVAYAPGSLPETSGDLEVPVEAELYTRDGLTAQTSNHVMADGAVRAVANHVLASGSGTETAVDASGPGGSPRRLFAEEELLGDADHPVPVVIVVSRSTAELQTAMRSLLAALVAGGVAVVGLGAALAWFVVGRALRPVGAMAAAARTISEQDLHRRVEVPAPDDELGQLEATFNDMLARLERAFDGLRRFTADASHELRGPLALMRTEVDVALGRPREPEDYARVLRSVQSEVDHLSRVTDQLLLLARADAGTLRPGLADVDVADLLEERAVRWQAAAAARGVTVAVHAPDSGTLPADPDLLCRIVDNLLDNAIRHSPDLGTVTLGAGREDGWWYLEVADQGPGVPAELRPRIFERFSRADAVRTRQGAGAGLGLALSAAAARAHGGTLELVDRPASGAVFRLCLPGGP